MWVRIADWMLVDDEPPRPVPASLLHSVGVRVRGEVSAADDATPDGVVAMPRGDRADPEVRAYAMTGIATDPREIRIKTTRWGRGESAGAEFVLSIGPDRFQVQFGGNVADMAPHSRVTVIGTLELVGAYEWDAFELRDTRADFAVYQVISMSNGDILVDVASKRDD